ncbi:MAG: iron-sulfur cluster assembly scaffold protein, partial [Lachnospiraceae bacterium]|nr:iron-sulfur cluster assembly scaffold protein [Lachnospiraceae bacterium]
MSETFYNEIINEHNLNPYHKHSIDGANFTLEGVNPSCGDDIILNLKVDESGMIVDGAYEGDGCAISQASADIMLDLVIGR